MNYCIFDVKRQRGENTVHSYDVQNASHLTKADAFRIQRMNYCIFDVKRQRGENAVIHTMNKCITLYTNQKGCVLIYE